MPAFVFRPYCFLDKPFSDCSDGWAVYEFVGLLAAVGFRKPIASLVWLVAALVAYYGFGYGITGLEIALHFAVGSAFGALILRQSKGAPPSVSGGLLHNYTGSISFSIVILLSISAFAYIDERISENGKRYGVVGSFIAILFFWLVTHFSLHVVNKVAEMPPKTNELYWKQWNQVGLSIFVFMVIALAGNISSYVKAGLSLILVSSALMTYGRTN